MAYNQEQTMEPGCKAKRQEGGRWEGEGRKNKRKRERREKEGEERGRETQDFQISSISIKCEHAESDSQPSQIYMKVEQNYCFSKTPAGS